KPPLVPVGEAFANIVPDPGAEVLGVLYELTPADWEHVELTEGVRIGNYRSVTVRAAALAEPALEVDAFALTSDRRDPTLTPSERYMACLGARAEEHGLPPQSVAVLRRRPARPATPQAAALRPRLGSAAAARAGRGDAPPLRALRRLRHVLAGGVRGRDRPGPLPAPRRGDELPQDRRAVRPARHDRVARRTHELLPRELRLRRRGAHRRHRALPALRGLRRRGPRDASP